MKGNEKLEWGKKKNEKKRYLKEKNEKKRRKDEKTEKEKEEYVHNYKSNNAIPTQFRRICSLFFLVKITTCTTN